MNLKIHFSDFNSNIQTFYLKWFGINIKNFPKTIMYKNKYWAYVMWDEIKDGTGDYLLLFSEVPSSLIPVDSSGQPFPVPNIEEMGNGTLDKDFNSNNSLKCECGSEKVYGINMGHSDWCPKYEKFYGN